MRLRQKFIALNAVIFLSVLSVVAFSVITLYRMELLRDTVDAGAALLERSRTVRSLTKDIMIGAFAPDTYADLKDVVYFEPYTAAVRDWRESAQAFRTQFGSFMEEPVLRDLVRRGILGDEYETAWIMSRKAFASLDSLQARVESLRLKGLLGSDNLYARIQTSSDPELIALFSELRETSYYLTNNFESYLNYFIESLEAESAIVRRDLLIFFVVIGIVTAIAATAISLLFSTRLVNRLKTVGESVRRVSLGDFSTPLDFRTGDEFETLSRDFNEYTGALKKNLGAMVALARNVAESALAMERAEADQASGPSLGERVIEAIVEAAVADSGASGAVFVVRAQRGPEVRAARGNIDFIQEDGGALAAAIAALADGAAPCVISDGRSASRTRAVLAGPLGASDRRYGTLALGVSGRGFNDLDLLRFANFLEFAGLVADNAAQYSELAGLRAAEYQALQSQVRPHFLYNVLSGFAALNRMGETRTLERSILALRELLRYSVDHGESATVAEELAFCERYCELQGMRFQDRLGWRVSNGAGPSWRVPKLLLQPLVENAIIHGIEGKGERGTVVIEARETAGGDGGRTLVLSVSDDGSGFDQDKAEKGVGLRNVERRLALAYPGSRMAVSSRPGEGTSVVLELPEARP
jgi:sensor histidine kinase YesM